MRKNIVTIIIIISVATSAVVLSIFLLPDQQLLTVIKSDVFFLEPQAAYEKRLKDGNYSPEVVLPLMRIYLRDKKYDKAIVLLEQYVNQYPDDVRVLEQLGSLYMNSGNQLGYASVLERLNKIRPDMDNLKLLSDIYNIHQEYERQAIILERLIMADPYQTQNYLWLAYIYRELFDYEKAAIVLEMLQNRFPDYIDYEIQELWLYSLVRLNRTEYSFMLADEWINRARADNLDYVILSVRLASIFFNQNKADLSYLILEPLKEYWHEPFLISEIVKTELALGRHRDAYRRLLNYYCENGRPEEYKTITYRVSIAYVNILINSDRLLEALDQLRLLKRAGFNVENVYYSTLYLAAEFDENSRHIYFDYLRKELSDRRTTRSRRLQIIMYFDYYGYSDAFELEIRRNAMQTAAPDEWYFLYERLLQNQGREQEWRAFLNEYYSRPQIMEIESGAPRGRRLKALQHVLEFGTTGAYEPEIRRYAYIAESEWFFLYRDLFYQQGRHDEWERFKESFINSPHSDPKIKREFAHDAIAQEDYAQALKVLYSLAEHAKPDNPDVEMLLFLWGARPDDQQINWIVKRLSQSISSSEEQAWLKHLFNHGGYRHIVLYVTKLPLQRRTPNMTPLYLHSLYYLNKLSHLENELNQIASYSANPDELEFAGIFAKMNGLYEPAAKAFLKLEEYDPYNSEMLLNLGIIRHKQKRYEEALLYFDRYHQQGGDDYISFYYTGISYMRLNELMPQRSRHHDYKPFFTKTIEKAKTVGDDKQARFIIAHAHIYIGNDEEAERIMTELIADYPDDKQLMLDYAAMLVSAGKYSQARKFVVENLQDGFKRHYPQTTIISKENVLDIKPTQLPNELAVYYGSPITERQIEYLEAELPLWIRVSAIGYNMLILATEPGYKLQKATVPESEQHIVLSLSPIITSTIR